MQHHSNILANHLKYMYMLLMCLTQSHSYMFPFIKTRGGCVYSEGRSAHLDGSVEVKNQPRYKKKYYFAIYLSYVKGNLAI